MSRKKSVLMVVVLASLLGLVSSIAIGVLPDDFPGITTHIYDANDIADGYIFLSVSKDVEGVGYYVMILENDGTVVWYKELPDDYSYDFNVQMNGYLHYAQLFHHHTYAGGGDVVHEILDENYNEVETIEAGNGYVAEAHDFQLLPNGNVLLFGYYLSEVDMSQLVNDGHPGAQVSGTIVQELDSQRNVVFQWRSWDYYTFEDFFSTLTDDSRAKKAAINAFHVNAMSQDTDGNIFVMTPQPASRLPRSGWVKKINRQTGEVMWTLGGDDNEFTFVGVDPEEGRNHFTGHGIYRLANGNVMNYDNGKYDIRSSQVHEYKLDEENKIAEHVWTYVPDTMIFGTGRGNVQRLPNGNTMIGWGNVRGTYKPTATEVTPDGKKVWELFFDNPSVGSYRAFRFPYPPATQAIAFMETELATGNMYDMWKESDPNTHTGVTIKVNSGGGGYNECTVTRAPYAPVKPAFTGKAPRVLPVRVKIEESDIGSMEARIDFDTASFGFADPANLTVYHRNTPGFGMFYSQATTNTGSALRITETLNSVGGDFGEFIFCYDDVADVAYPPILHQPESYRGVQDYAVIAPPKAEPSVVYEVNHERDILLSFSPKGLARWYFIEVATDENFTNLVVDETEAGWMSECQFIWTSAATNPPAPNTTYYWRARIYNANAEYSDWSTGMFQTVPPMIEVTVPIADELITNGTDYLIQWTDNIAEDVVIELYKGATMVQTIGTVPSDRTYEWLFLGIEPGTDYSIKVSSSTNPSLFDFSETFRIDILLGDLNEDGEVNLLDVGILAGNYLQ